MSCRIFIEETDIPEDKGSTFRLFGEESKYIAKVLRLKEGDRIIICTGDGKEYSCTLSSVEERSVLLNLDGVEEVDRESNLDIILCQALPKAKKMDLIIQKGTELGVKRFIPFISSRSVSRPKDKEGSEKVRRWEKIALEAARQCGRNFTPGVDSVSSLEEVLGSFSGSDEKKTLKIIPWEEEESMKIGSLSSTPLERVIVLIGPEGGFSSEEVKIAKDAGFAPVSLGRRLLRTETAGFATVSILQYLWGDMG